MVSRGLAGGPDSLPASLEDALADDGLTVGRPVGVPIHPADVQGADLCLFMERRLLREVVVVEPSCWPRAFTLREFARRSLADPPGAGDDAFAPWIARLHAGRTSEELLGVHDADDLTDPGLGAEKASYAGMIASLSELVRAVTPLLTSWSST